MPNTMLILLKHPQSLNRGCKSRMTQKKKKKRGGKPQAWAEGKFQNGSFHHGECPHWVGVSGKAADLFSSSWDYCHACWFGLQRGNFGFDVWGKNTCLTQTPLTNGCNFSHNWASLHLEITYITFLILVFKTPCSSVSPRMHQLSSMVWKAPSTSVFCYHSLPTKLTIIEECLLF